MNDPKIPLTLRESIDQTVRHWAVLHGHSTKDILDYPIVVDVIPLDEEWDDNDEVPLDDEYSFHGTYAGWLYHISTTMYGWIGEVTNDKDYDCTYVKDNDEQWVVWY